MEMWPIHQYKTPDCLHPLRQCVYPVLQAAILLFFISGAWRTWSKNSTAAGSVNILTWKMREFLWVVTLRHQTGEEGYIRTPPYAYKQNVSESKGYVVEYLVSTSMPQMQMQFYCVCLAKVIFKPVDLGKVF